MGSFLQKHWSDIQPSVASGNDPSKCRARGFLYPWNHDESDMDMIKKAMRTLRPKVVIELGTFEGLGTLAIAETMYGYLKDTGYLYTFDYGDAPVNTLGVLYGYDEDVRIIPWTEASNDWAVWGDVIEARNCNLGIIHDRYSDKVKCTFIKGLTTQTLPEWIDIIGEWDFVFQDTVHTPKEIIEEWFLYRFNAHIGSVVVFDDIGEGNWLPDYFRECEDEWIIRHSTTGRKQLWVEKVK